MQTHYPLFLAGKEVDTSQRIEVRSPWNGELFATVARAGAAELERAAQVAAEAFTQTRQLPSWQREEILTKLAGALAARAEEFAQALVMEVSKPIRLARDEVSRGVHTLRAAAGEATRLHGEIIPLDTARSGAGKTGFVRRVPAGPVAAIAPFNFPLNLALHKIAPAAAVGNTAVLKPAAATPVTACLLAGIYAETGAPAGLLSVVPCDRSVGQKLVTDPRFKVLSFTGSPAAGWPLRAAAGRKRVALELGGNAAVIVHDDADLDWAAKRIVAGAFGFSGQSCISVQRVLVHRSCFGELTERILAGTKALCVGDPRDEKTDLGPLINTAAADRVMAWIGKAKKAGAQLLCGGERDRDLITPAVLAGVSREAEIDRCEAFGPVVNLHEYTDFEEAITQVNDSAYGLQAGLFTRDIDRALRAWDRIEAGGIVVNDISTFRVDTMPYGGVKESGCDREGPAWAMEHMTETRLLAIHSPATGTL